MGRPLVAIVGSADPTRRYDPPLRHLDLAPGAAAMLGRELARQGCDIVVYSSKPQFIEADVVRADRVATRRAALVSSSAS